MRDIPQRERERGRGGGERERERESFERERDHQTLKTRRDDFTHADLQNPKFQGFMG
jgi:hypothetical protein